MLICDIRAHVNTKSRHYGMENVRYQKWFYQERFKNDMAQ